MKNILKIDVTNVYERNAASPAKIIINQGGAGSSKSYSICQLIAKEFHNRDKYEALIVRKTMKSLKTSTMKDMHTVMKENKTFWDYKFHGSDFTHKYLAKDNLIIYSGMDTYEKIKSHKFCDIFCEEANELTLKDIVVLLTRLRGATAEDGTRNRIFLAYNPSDDICWITDKLSHLKDRNGKSQVEVIHSTHRDNPFLDKDYIETLEGLKDIDEDFYKIYAEGQYATKKIKVMKPLIFINPEEYPRYRNFGEHDMNVDPKSPVKYIDKTTYGLDFGFNDPTTLVKIDHVNYHNPAIPNERYVTELLYQSLMESQEIADRVDEIFEILGLSKDDTIYADHDPEKILLLKRKGLNVRLAYKKKDSVRGSIVDGLIYMKLFKFISTSDNHNLNQEWDRYRWKKDKEDNILDDPEDRDNHSIDATRYGVFSDYKRAEPGIFYLSDNDEDDYFDDIFDDYPEYETHDDLGLLEV